MLKRTPFFNFIRSQQWLSHHRRTNRPILQRAFAQGSFSHPVPFIVPEDEIAFPPIPSGAQDLKKYHDLVATALEGGGPRGIERHVTKNRKVLIRDRIKMILDPGSPFIEVGQLAGFDMPYGDLPAGGVVTGIGRVKGVYCMVSGNDATVKAGTYYPITVKKSGRVQHIAEMNRLPTIYLPDSGGAFLPLQSEIFIHGGRGFYNQAVMSSQGIPQIAVVCGSCTAGGAYNPTMSDEAVIIDRISKIFLGGPPLVKAATGEIVTDEDLGGAFMHSSVSGCTDYFAQTEEEGFSMCREIVESLDFKQVPKGKDFSHPKNIVNWNDLLGKTHLSKMEMYSVLSSLLDGSTFKEFKAFYGPGLITATGYIEGSLVGVIANWDDIMEAESLKAAHFIDMCIRRETPLLFLQNSKPESSFLNHSVTNALKFRSSMAAAVATANVPKISLTLTNCVDDDYILMCGPGSEPNLNFTWPSAKFSPFGMLLPPVEEDLVCEVDAFYASFNMIIDAMIPPEETRKVIAESLRIVKQQFINPPVKGLKRPVLRM